MGCQCSQASTLTPQQPHVIEQDHLKLQPHQKTPQIPIEAAKEKEPSIFHDKENQKPKKTILRSPKDVPKQIGEKWPATQTKLGVNGEKKSSNMLEKIDVLQQEKKKQNKVEKPPAARSENDIANQPQLGPSSKSIQLHLLLKQEPKDKELEKEMAQPIKAKDSTLRNQIQAESQRKIENGSSKKVKSSKEVKQEHKKSLNIQNTFVFENWQKKQQEELSKKQRLQKVDEMQVERQEVTHYLQTVCDYEKEVLNNIIDHLQLQEQKKFEQSPLDAL